MAKLPPKESRKATVLVRVKESELTAIAKAAKDDGRSLSQWSRLVMLAAVQAAKEAGR